MPPSGSKYTKMLERNFQITHHPRQTSGRSRNTVIAAAPFRYGSWNIMRATSVTVYLRGLTISATKLSRTNTNMVFAPVTECCHGFGIVCDGLASAAFRLEVAQCSLNPREDALQVGQGLKPKTFLPPR